MIDEHIKTYVAGCITGMAFRMGIYLTNLRVTLDEETCEPIIEGLPDGTRYALLDEWDRLFKRFKELYDWRVETEKRRESVRHYLWGGSSDENER